MDTTTKLSLHRNLNTLKKSRAIARSRSTEQDSTDCLSAVSPLAYLADLLDYAVKHITKDGILLKLSDLETYFHQPFGQIPTTCEAIERDVAQIRICIEVLRVHLKQAATESTFKDAEKAYRGAAYRSILWKLGTNPEEVQSIAKADETTRYKLAAKLGIAEAHLSDLWRSESKLTESWLESTFGLANTKKVVFSLEEGHFLKWQKEQLPAAANALYGEEDSDEKTEWLSDQQKRQPEKMQKIVREVEEQTLPILRRALLPDLSTARQMSDQLLINCEYDPCFRTSRVSQAITTLQQLITGLRNGTMRDTHPELVLHADQFAEEWQWLGTYQNWRSAMMIFLFPENLLDPGLRRDNSPVLQGLIDRIRKERRLSRKQADAFQKEFGQYYDEVLQLQVDATCAVKNRLYLAGSTPNGKAFFSLATGGSQSPWSEIPGFSGQAVYKVLSVVAQGKDRELETLLVFVITVKRDQIGHFSGAEYQLHVHQFDIVTGNWREEPVPLSLPGSISFGPYLEEDTPENRLIIEQLYKLENRPYVLFKGENTYLLNQLNAEGNDWLNEEWRSWKMFPNQYPEIIYALFRVNKQLVVATHGGGMGDGHQSYLGHLNFQTGNKFGIIPTLNIDNKRFPDLKVIIDYEWAPTINDPAPTIWCFANSEAGGAYSLYQFRSDSNGKNFKRIFGPKNLGDRFKIACSNGNASVYSLPINKTDVIRMAYTNLMSADNRVHHHKYEGYFSLKEGDTWTNGNLTVPLPPEEYDRYDVETNRNVLSYAWEADYFLPVYLALQLQRNYQYVAAKDYYRLVYDYGLPPEERKVFFGLKMEEEVRENLTRGTNWLSDPLNPHAIAVFRQNAYTEYTIMSIARCLLREADAAFTLDTSESLAQARNLYLEVLSLLKEMGNSEIATDKAIPANSRSRANSLAALLQKRLKSQEDHAPDEGANAGYSFAFAENALLNINAFEFTVPENLLWQYLKLHAEVNLFKLNSCRNISGEQRIAASIGASGLNFQDFISLGNGSLSRSAAAAVTFQPTPFRYSVLVERAKQLVSLAQQLEASFLNALEKLDTEQFNLLNAQNEMQLSKAGIRLQDLRLNEANVGVKLAGLQLRRSEIQNDHFSNLLAEGLNFWEEEALKKLESAYDATSTRVATEAIKATFTFGLGGDPVGAAIAESQAGASLNQAIASFERRSQEWELQEQLSNQDILIGVQQKQMAEGQVNIVDQERNIATLRSDQAETVAQFLMNKFTNAELYDWMSEVLEGVYSFFLQQATATAQLATQQLKFERQDPIPSIILADYWEPAKDYAENGSTSDKDRRGLTGSARLLQDIYQLDQYALQTDRRKLQLTKTISLSSLSPAEFQQFRQTGKLPFYTLMEYFDRDFPGHYLRLIKRVRVSVIALTPGVEGIKATLSNNGISRVVVPGLDSFDTTNIRRLPESIALTGTLNASGVFDFEPTDQSKLRPFESMGVDTAWEFALPKATNVSLDYDTIADVLITIDYTALHSEDYKKRVIQELGTSFSADRAYSFRNDFPDQWYDLHHPELLAEEDQLTVHFEILPDDFPPNLTDVKVKHVTLFLPQDDYADMAISVNRQGKAYPHSSRMTPEGITSTRQAGNSVGRWQPLLGRAPEGTWTLSFPNNEAVRGWFKAGRFRDIILLITYEGKLIWD